MTQDAPLVRAKGLGHRFGSTEVLGGVDLTVSAGEIVGIVGPNGGGKSTLLMLLAGLLRPSSGTVEVQGRVGLVMASPGLYPLLTGWENLRYFGRLEGLSEAVCREKASGWLGELGLTGAMDRRTGAWSSGMQQKLSLVRALLVAPSVLLFDEPTAHLDPVSARTIFEVLGRRAAAGVACVLVSHDLAAVESICDRALLIDGGIRKTLDCQRASLAPPGPLLTAWMDTLETPS